MGRRLCHWANARRDPTRNLFRLRVAIKVEGQPAPKLSRYWKWQPCCDSATNDQSHCFTAAAPTRPKHAACLLYERERGATIRAWLLWRLWYAQRHAASAANLRRTASGRLEDNASDAASARDDARDYALWAIWAGWPADVAAQWHVSTGQPDYEANDRPERSRNASRQLADAGREWCAAIYARAARRQGTAAQRTQKQE